jgi:hypothetical protein
MMQPGRAKQSLKAINEIFAAVSMRDGDWAAAACSDPICSAAIVALQMLESEQTDLADGESKRGNEASYE